MAAGHPWLRIDLKGSLARWLDAVEPEERVEWWKHPEDIDLYAKTEWKARLIDCFRKEVGSTSNPDGTVFAITGLMELYDFIHVSELIDALEQSFPGFLLVFFPGEKERLTVFSTHAPAGTTWPCRFCRRSKQNCPWRGNSS